MKRYFILLFVAAFASFALSCQKVTTEGVTNITKFFTLNGAETIFLGIGQEYVEPGYTPYEGASDVKVEIRDAAGEVVDAVNTESAGFYTIYYSNTSAEGFPLTKTRNVYIYDDSIETSLKGSYKVDLDLTMYGSRTFADRLAYYKGLEDNTAPHCTDNYTIEIETVVGNIYSISDYFAGWYSYIRGRGPYYAATYGSSYLTYFDMAGFIVLNADMTLSMLTSKIRAWGDGLDYLENGVYDPETGTLSYDVLYASAIAISPVMVKQ